METKSIRDAFRALVGPIMKGNPKGRPIDKDGKIYLDPTPVAPPIGYQRHKPMYEIIREQVRAESLRLAEQAEVESFDDADDFRIGDDFDPTSPYEYDFEPQVDPQPLPEGQPLKAGDPPGGGSQPATAAQGSRENPAGAEPAPPQK